MGMTRVCVWVYVLGGELMVMCNVGRVGWLVAACYWWLCW